MSDDYLRIFPTDPAFVPPKAAADEAVQLLIPELPEAHRILAESYGCPAFIDQGANLEEIICPSCSTHLVLHPFDEVDPVRDWWYGISDPLGGKDVSRISVAMLCCGATVPFLSLTYDWPAGVASFEISVLNPGIGEVLPVPTISKLEAVLGCGLRQVWAHY